jgi:hypothetical protein
MCVGIIFAIIQQQFQLEVLVRFIWVWELPFILELGDLVIP